MISLSNISKAYGGQILFYEASFFIGDGEKVGLVGPNGAGKSTIFRMITGEEQPDDGVVDRPKRTTVGYFRQDVGDLKGRSVMAETLAGAGEVGRLGEEMKEIEAILNNHEDPKFNDAVERFSDVQARFHFEGGLIADHHDDFDFYRWSRQALGPTGLLLGWSPIVRSKVRRMAAGRLAKFSGTPGPAS